MAARTKRPKGPAVFPKEGTDNRVFLDALLEVYPGWLSRPKSSLHLTANSRASELRDKGWDIESKPFPNPDNPRKRDHRYRLVRLPSNVVDPTMQHPVDDNGQLRIA